MDFYLEMRSMIGTIFVDLIDLVCIRKIDLMIIHTSLAFIFWQRCEVL